MENIESKDDGNLPKCKYCENVIKDFEYYPYCNWNCRDKHSDFKREYQDMYDGFTNG